MNKLLNIILTNPKKTCSLFVFISLISLILISNLKINTSTDSLISENLDFKKNQKKLKDSFKVLNNNILIRIKGENYNEVKFVSEKIVENLKLIFLDFPFFLRIWDCVHQKERREVVENEVLDVKKLVDTAENGPSESSKKWPN